MMRTALIAAAFTAHAIAETAAPTAEQLRGIVRKAIDGLKNEDDRRGQFLFKARNERKELDASGKVLNLHSHSWERIEIDGFPFGRTLERDGKPLTGEERKTEDAAIQKRLAELKVPKATEASVGALSTRGGGKSQHDDWYMEFPDALDFKLVRQETINNRLAWHLEAWPKPQYQAKNMRARVFGKMKANFWIDKASSELVKADAEMFDTVSVGFGVLGKIEKGTRFRLQRRQIADGEWLIESQYMRFGARILLFKTLRNESTTEWSEFRRRPKMLPAPKP